jgi:hypothetical protein
MSAAASATVSRIAGTAMNVTGSVGSSEDRRSRQQDLERDGRQGKRGFRSAKGHAASSGATFMMNIDEPRSALLGGSG